MPDARPPPQHPTRRWPRRLALGVLAAVAGVLLLLAVAIGVLIADPSVVASQVKSQALPRLSELLGRPVQVETVEVHLFPPRATLGGLRIGGRDEGRRPFAEVSQASASLRLWPLLRSRGQEVLLRSIVLERPRINLVRGRDGRWNVPTIELEPSEREVVISSLEIRDGELHLVDRMGGAASESVALRRINLRAEHLGDLEREATAALTAALAEEEPNLRVDARIPPGGRPEGEFSIDALDLGALRAALPSGLGETITGGRIALRGGFEPTKGAYEVKGQLNAPNLALRAQTASATLDFLARLPDAGAATVDLSRIRLKGPGVDLGGEAALRSQPLAATFALSGPLLDLDALLAALPAELEAEAEEGQAAEGTLPESMRRQLAGLTARGQLEVGRMVARKVELGDVVADARLARGVFVFERATAQLYGGRMDVAGTRIDLTRRVPTWELHGDLEGVQLGQAMEQTTGASPLRGVLDGRLDLAGTGDLWAQLRTNLTGKGRFALEDGTLTGADLGEAIAGQVEQALRRAGRAARSGRGGTGAGGPPQTALEEVGGSFTVKDGWVRFARPIALDTRFGKMRLEGGIGLDQRLSLKGRAELTPEFVAQIAGRAPPRPLTVPLQLGGTLSEPTVQIDSAGVVRGLLRQTPLPKAPEGLRERLEDRARDLFRTP